MCATWCPGSWSDKIPAGVSEAEDQQLTGNKYMNNCQLEEAPCDLRSKWEQELAAQRSGEKVTAGRGSSKCQGPEAGKVSVLVEQGDAWRGGRVVNGGATPTSHYFLSAMERSSGSLLPILKLPRLSVATFFF